MTYFSSCTALLDRKDGLVRAALVIIICYIIFDLCVEEKREAVRAACARHPRYKHSPLARRVLIPVSLRELTLCGSERLKRFVESNAFS